MFVPVVKTNYDLYGSAGPKISRNFQNVSGLGSTSSIHANGSASTGNIRKLSASTPLPTGALVVGRTGSSARGKSAAKKLAYYYSVPATTRLLPVRSPTFPTEETPTRSKSMAVRPEPGVRARRKKSLSHPSLPLLTTPTGPQPSGTSRSGLAARSDIEAIKDRMRRHGLGYSDEDDDDDVTGSTGVRRNSPKLAPAASKADDSYCGLGACLNAIFGACLRNGPTQKYDDDKVVDHTYPTKSAAASNASGAVDPTSLKDRKRRRSASAGDVSVVVKSPSEPELNGISPIGTTPAPDQTKSQDRSLKRPDQGKGDVDKNLKKSVSSSTTANAAQEKRTSLTSRLTTKRIRHFFKVGGQPSRRTIKLVLPTMGRVQVAT